MEENKPIIEGRLSLRLELPASLKKDFEEQCRLAGRSMVDVVIELISGYLEG